MMVRPKSDDPTVAIPIRLKRSAYRWWEKAAAQKGKKVAKVIQESLEAKAEPPVTQVEPRLKKNK